MMGPSHAAAGALLWAATAVPLTDRLGVPLTPQVAILGLLATAGAGLLPDLDTPTSTVAKSFGPFTQGLARVVGTLAGGHRAFTHSILFCILLGVGVYAAVHFLGPIAGLVTLFVLLGLAARGLGIAPSAEHLSGWLTVTGYAIAGTAAAVVLVPDKAWIILPYCVTVGALSHLLADALTPAGVPALSPVSKYRFAWPLLPKTGTGLETAILMPGMLVAALYLTVNTFWHVPLPTI